MSKQQLSYFRPYLNREDGGKDRPENRHHIIPISRGGVDSRENKIMLYEDLHSALHRVFGNGTPKEQLMQLLDINGKVFGVDFKEDIYKILKETDDKYYYKNGVLLPKK